MLTIPAILLCSLFSASPLQAGDHSRTVQIGEFARSYLVHVPPSYTNKKSMPVVLVFHGGGSSPEVMIRFCGMNQKADSAGFIVVYPRGTGRLERVLTFNGGNCCGYARNNKVDDVEFTRRILKDLATVLNTDSKRIYATGLSNGAIMAYRLASELSDQIAAIAPIGGPMGSATCRPKRSVPVIHFHGDNDQFAPYKGGKGKGLSGTNFYSVKHSIQAWVKANACKPKPTVKQVPDHANDGTSIVQETYDGGRNGSEVVLVTVKGGGHTWPGRQPHVRFLGKSTKNISANDLMWRFFQKHARK